MRNANLSIPILKIKAPIEENRDKSQIQNKGALRINHLCSISSLQNDDHDNTKEERFEESYLSDADAKDTFGRIFRKTNRSEEDLSRLYEKFKDLKFFRQFINNINEKERKDAILNIFKKVKYEFWQAESVIMRQGDYSNGEAKVMINNSKAKEEEKPPLTEVESNYDKRTAVVAKKDPMPRTPRRNKHTMTGMFTVLAVVKCRRLSRLAAQSHEPKDLKQGPGNSVRMQLSPFHSNAPTDIWHQNLFLNAVDSTPSNIQSSKMDLDIHRDKYEDFGSVIDNLQPGDYFGEKSLSKKQRRTATIITNTDAEFLVLDMDTFKYVKQEFEKAKTTMFEFMKTAFPNLNQVDSHSILDSLLYAADIREYPFRKNLGFEGQTGDEFYLIYEGQCEIVKTIIYDNSDPAGAINNEVRLLFALKKTKKEDVIVSNIEKGSFLSEEVCFDNRMILDYTVRVSSEKAKLICFKRNKFLMRCPKVILDGLQQAYAKKKERTTINLLEKLQKRGIQATYESLNRIKPTVTLTKIPSPEHSDLYRVQTTASKTDKSETRQTSQSILNLDLPDVVRVESSPKVMLSSRCSPNRKIPIDADYIPSTPRAGYSTERTPIYRNLIRDNVKETPIFSPLGGLRDPLLPSRAMTDFTQTRTTRVVLSREKRIPLQIKSPVGMNNESTANSIGSLRRLTFKQEAGSKTNRYKDEDFINNISNFKINFGDDNKDVERRYKALKSQIQPSSRGETRRTKTISGINLADLITRKLKEGNIGGETDRTPIFSKQEEFTGFEFNIDYSKSKPAIPSLNLGGIKKAWEEPKTPISIMKSTSSPRITCRESIIPPDFKYSESNPVGTATPSEFKSIINIGQPAGNKTASNHRRSNSDSIFAKEVVNIHVSHNSSPNKKPFLARRLRTKTMKQ